MPTFAPFFRNSRTIVNPMPRVPPVTMATLSFYDAHGRPFSRVNSHNHIAEELPRWFQGRLQSELRSRRLGQEGQGQGQGASRQLLIPAPGARSRRTT